MSIHCVYLLLLWCHWSLENSPGKLLNMYAHLKRINWSYSNLYKRGRNDLLNALKKIKDIGIMVCPPYIFAVDRLAGEYFVTDTHAIDNRIGGNGNGIVI